MDEKFKKLSGLGAGDFEHIDGSLIEHLKNTKSLLKKWGAREELQDAGLYHAAYGTAGFTKSLVSSNQRSQIAAIIGSEAEKIVYLYCACDRELFWPQFSGNESLLYKNRFTTECFQLTQEELKALCELTVANELEIAQDNEAFIEESGAYLFRLFSAMSQFLSSAANSSVQTILGNANA